jgi:leader peptidase (prepilin peptidase)/N-methyltransferase
MDAAPDASIAPPSRERCGDSRQDAGERMRAPGAALVAAVLAAVLAAVAVLALGERAALVPALHLAATTPLLWLADVREHRLPNRLVLPNLALALLAALAAGALGDGAPLLAGLGTGAALLTLSLVGGLGMGDAKLGAALALTLGAFGVEPLLLALLLALLGGGIVSAAGLVARRLRRGQAIAFGPFLLAGAWAVLGMQALAALR